MKTARADMTRKETSIGNIRFQLTYFKYFSITTVDDVSESIPESVTASAYEGIRKGSTVMMNIPKPKPVVLWTKLAPAARSMIYRIFSGIYELKE